MIEISWEVDGRQVSPEELADAIVSEILQQLSEEVQEELSQSTCPEHGEQPAVTIQYAGGGELSCTVTACCNAFSDSVREKIKGMIDEAT